MAHSGCAPAANYDNKSMAEVSADPLESILRHVAAAAPQPWYPKLHAESAGVVRDSLDAPLEKLRLANLIRLTEWEQGRGQGYVLTAEGMHALNDGRALGRVRDGKVKPRLQSIGPPRREARVTAYEQGEDVRSVFLNPVNPIVTKSLIFANVLVFLAGYFLATNWKLDANAYFAGQDKNGLVRAWRVMHAIGGLEGADVARGGWDWVRLLTSCFVHIGLVHLLMNLVGLYVLGRDAESMFGHWRFLVIYLLSGFAGGCGMLIDNVGGGAGASGAVCGLLGAIIVWFLLNRARIPPEVASRGLRLLMINVVLVIGISLFMAHVSKGGHLGGGIAGAAIAAALHFQRYGRGIVRWLALLGVVLVPAASIGALRQTMSTQPEWGQVRERVKTEERNDLAERYHRDCEAAAKAGKAAFEDAYDVVKNHPSRRAPEDKARAIEISTQARTGLRDAIVKLSGGRAYSNPDAEELRREAIGYLQAGLDLLELTERLLRDDQNLIGANEKALEEQKAKVKELRKQLFGKP